MNAPSASRVDRIRQHLQDVLQPARLEIIDESHLHVGHAGAREGKGHFRVQIVAQQFAGLRPLQRHQLIYRALGEMMQTDIHALSIDALAPAEAP